jgi:hypothetical protein
MNWVRDVKGASHIDMALMKHAALDAGDEESAEDINHVGGMVFTNSETSNFAY